jgi:hypothetical protein
MLLRNMVTDPRTGQLVDPSWAEDPEPKPFDDAEDGIALHRTAPNRDKPPTVIYFGDAYDRTTERPAPPLRITTEFDSPTIAVT